MSADLAPQPLACDAEHRPGCYNPWHDRTWCICGAVTWPGQVGTWHSSSVRTNGAPTPHLGIGTGAPGLVDRSELLGYRVYFLHADGCADQDAEHGLCEVAS